MRTGELPTFLGSLNGPAWCTRHLIDGRSRQILGVQMSAKAHQHLLETSLGLSTSLRDAITTNGSIQLRRRLRSGSFPVVLCRAVAGQQLSVKAARTIWGRVLDEVGDRELVDYLGGKCAKPLRACGLSGAKTKAMQSIAQAERAGELDVATLGALDHEERAKKLTAIWGVGQWTADMMGIFYFGDRDIWPDGDVTARKTLQRLTSKRRKTVRTAQRFAPYRSYLALHMWRHADAAPT